MLHPPKRSNFLSDWTLTTTYSLRKTKATPKNMLTYSLSCKFFCSTSVFSSLLFGIFVVAMLLLLACFFLSFFLSNASFSLNAPIYGPERLWFTYVCEVRRGEEEGESGKAANFFRFKTDGSTWIFTPVRNWALSNSF